MYIFHLAGAKFRSISAQAETIELVIGDRLELRRDAENSFDPNAIEVVSVISSEVLGFVPKHIAAELAPKLDAGGPEAFNCTVKNVYNNVRPRLEITRAQ